ncbi:MAG: preprotein translocase subunit SecG [Ruminiclostridium sp.]|nr:preprotein translocase subunit SecG [Ruminiclostridium sp.]
MTVIEIIFAILLILSCVFIIAVVLMQESKQGMSNVISGGSSDNYFQKNSGRTKEAKLSRATKVAAVIVFVVAIAVNLITVYWGGDQNSSSASDNIAVVTDADFSIDDIAPDSEATEAPETAAPSSDEAQDVVENTVAAE